MSIIVKLEHTVEEVDKILLALAKRPFEEVSDLINKIRGQGLPQVNAVQAAAPAAETVTKADPDPEIPVNGA